eukprot:g47530.t1
MPYPQSRPHMTVTGVVHRDLKPENILVSGRDPTDVKLADFGTAGRMGPGRDKLLTHRGSLSYVAPEVLKHLPYGCEVDIWSLGVIIYRMLSDSLPFSDPNTAVKMRKVKEGQYSFPREKWDRIDPDGTGPIDLIKRCLVVDPALRITAPEILQHPWVSRHFKPLKRSGPTPHMPASPWLYSSSPPRRPALGMMDRLPDILLDSSSTDVTPQSQSLKSMSPPVNTSEVMNDILLPGEQNNMLFAPFGSRTDAASIQLWKQLQLQTIQPQQIQPLPSPSSRHRRSSFS